MNTNTHYTDDAMLRYACSDALAYKLLYTFKKEFLFKITTNTLDELTSNMEDIFYVKELSADQHFTFRNLVKEAWKFAMHLMAMDGTLFPYQTANNTLFEQCLELFLDQVYAEIDKVE